MTDELNLELYTSGTGQKVLVHPESECRGRHCVIHNPSDHHMRDWPTHWRNDRKIMERICPHGVGHPDPDDMSPDRWHGCDGCCVAPGTELEHDQQKLDAQLESELEESNFEELGMDPPTQEEHETMGYCPSQDWDRHCDQMEAEQDHVRKFYREMKTEITMVYCHLRDEDLADCNRHSTETLMKYAADIVRPLWEMTLDPNE